MTSSDLSVVLRPQVGTTIRPTSDQSFVYVLRDDTTYIAREFRERLTAAGVGSATEAQVAAAYQGFLDGLYQAFAVAARTESFKLHVYSSQEVERVRDELQFPGPAWLSTPCASHPARSTSACRAGIIRVARRWRAKGSAPAFLRLRINSPSCGASSATSRWC